MSYKKKNFGKRFFPEIFFGKRIGKRPFIIPGIPGIPESHPWSNVSSLKFINNSSKVVNKFISSGIPKGQPGQSRANKRSPPDEVLESRFGQNTLPE